MSNEDTPEETKTTEASEATEPVAEVTEATEAEAPAAAAVEAAYEAAGDAAAEGGEEAAAKSSEGAPKKKRRRRARPKVVDEEAIAAELGGDDDDDDDDDFGMLARVDDESESGGAAAGAEEEVEPELAENPEIPLESIDADALWVVKRLRAKGYEAYLTGGCVRDLLLGREPKDFDVATAAHPNEVKAVFRNCRLIGRRFRLAHVYFPGGKIIETATFRANPLDELEDLPEDLLVERDNVFGNVEDDARRRDLTINGLFYDPLAGKVLDFVDGRPDLEKRLIRTIGDPQIRFREDPVRIIRAIKFATRLGFDFETDTWQAMKDHTSELLRCAAPRLQEEMLRLLGSGHAKKAYELCRDVGLLEVLMPELLSGLNDERAHFTPAPPPAPEPEAPPAEAAAEGEPAGEVEAVAEGEVATEGEPAEAASEAPAEAAPEGEAEASEAAEAASAEAAPEPVPAPEPVSLDPVPAPTSEQRWERFWSLLATLDEVRSREVEVSSGVMLSTLLLSSWEAYQASDDDGVAWLDGLCNTWSERLRLTRRDKELMDLLLKSLELYSPPYRRGAAAKQLVGRPWFREGLLLYTLGKHAAGVELDEVAAWKAIANHYDKPYRQPKVGEPKPQNRARKPRRSRRGGGGGGGGRGRGRGRR
jgi:poly(A) polymerase